MASSGKQLNVKMNFQVDTTQAQQQLRGLYQQLNQMTSASAFNKNTKLGITSQILEATKAAAQLKVALAEAVNPLTGNLDLAKFNDQLKMSGVSLADYRKSLSALGTSGNAAFNQLARSISTAEIPMLRMGKAAQTMWTVLGNTVRWQATSSILHGIMSTASQAMGYVKSLDASLNNIRIVTGQSQEQMARFAKTANQAAKELNTSTNEYAKASLIYYQQGLSNKQVEERTRATIKLANVAGQSAKTVSDQMTAVWNNFYDGSKSLEYYADVITALGASTASSSEEIAKGLQKFSSIAQTTGLSYEYATSALSTVVAATRQSADSVGTSFKTLFSRLQGLQLGETLDDGTTLNKYSQALNVVGVNIKKANGDLKSMDNILDEIGEKWQHLSQDSKVALAQTVGGVRNYTGLMSLMDHWDEFQTNLKTAQTAQGTLQNQADIYAQSWQAASAHVKAASETIYKNLLDDNFFKWMTNGFGSVLDIIGEMTNSLGGFKGSWNNIIALSTNLFRPQISQMLGNFGASIYGLTGKGQQELIDLRTNARNAVTEKLRFSQYDSVNNLTHSYNQAFNARQVAYENAVQQGRISQLQQPVYQMLLNNMAQQEQQVIQAAEQGATKQLGYTRDYNQARSDLTSMINSRYDALAKEFDSKGLNAQMVKKFEQYRSGTRGDVEKFVSKNQDAYARYEAYLNSLQNGRLNVQGLDSLINDYQKAITGETAIANIQQIMDRHQTGELSAISNIDDLRLVATDLQRLAIGAKESGENLDNIIPGLGQFSSQIAAMGGDISKMPLDKLQGLFGTDFGDAIRKYYENAGLGSLRSSEIATKIEDQIRTALGYQEGEGTTIISKARDILTSSKLSAEERVSQLRTLGITKEQQEAIEKGLLNEKSPQVMQMSGALTTVVGGLSALSNTIVSTVNTVKTFGDENATATQKIGAMGSVAMSLGMLAPQVKQFGTHMNDVVSIFGKSTKMTVGQMGLWGAIAAAGLVIGSAAIKDIRKTTMAGAIENYNTALATSTQLANDAKSAYENLLTVSSKHNNLLDNLQGLRIGTQEFTTSLLEANEIATDIIEKYDLIYGKDYTYSSSGAINFQAGVIDNTIEKARQEMLATSIGRQQINYAKQILDTSIKMSTADDRYLPAFADQNVIGTTVSGIAQSASVKDIVSDINSLILDRQAIAEGIYEGRRSWVNPYYTEEDLIKEYLNGSKMYSPDGSGIATFFELNDLFSVLDVQDIDQAAAKLTTLVEAFAAGDTDEINSLFNPNYKSNRQLKNEAAIQGLVNVSISGIEQDIKNKDLIGSIVANSLIDSGKATSIMSLVNRESMDTFFNQGDLSVKDWYTKLYGKEAPEDLTPEDLTTKVMEGLLNEIILYGPTSKKLRGAESLLSSLGDFQGFFEIAKELSTINLPNIENLTYTDIDEAFDSLKEYKSLGFGGIKVQTDSELNSQLDLYKKQVQNLFDQQLYNLQDALLASFTDTANGDLGITIAETGRESPIFKEAVAALSGPFKDQLGRTYTSLTYGALKQAVNAMTNANQVGVETGQAMYDILLRGRNYFGGFNADTLKAIQSFNFNNSIEGVYRNLQLQRYAQNSRQSSIYATLLSKQIEDMQREKGFFNALYNSSGFADVMDNLRTQFDETGKITTQNITDLANKSETLSQFLKLGAEHLNGLNINAAGLASIFTEINKGTLSTNFITSELISAMSTAGSRSAVTSQAFEIVDNLDLGRSNLDLLDYTQTMGKAAYQAQKAGLGFYSDPIQNIIQRLGGADVKYAYAEANSHSDWSFKEMWDYLPKYLTDFLDTAAGKKGKGGGGAADTWSLIYNTLANNNLEGFGTDEFWKNLGIKIDKNGNFMLDSNDTRTGEELTEALVIQLTKSGMDEEFARSLAKVAFGFVSTSGQTGAVLDSRGAQKGLQELLSSETPQNIQTLHSFFNANQTVLRDANNEIFKDFDAFLKYYRDQGGNIGYIAENASDWQGMTVEQLIANAKNAGTTYDRWNGRLAGAPSIIPDSAFYTQNVGVETFADLAAAYGAYNQKTGAYDYNALIRMIESMNGSEADLIEILKNLPTEQQIENIYGKDKYGNIIHKEQDQTWEDFLNDINTVTGQDYVNNRGITTQGAADVAAGMRALYFTNPITGEAIFDPTGSEEAKYNKTVQSGYAARSSMREAQGKNSVTDFSNLTTEQMDAILADTASQIRLAAFTNADQKAWLDLYNNFDKYGLTQEDANKLLTQLLFNTDTLVDDSGILVEATEEENQETPDTKKTFDENTDADIDENNNLTLPDNDNTKSPSGNGWEGAKGSNWGPWQYDPGSHTVYRVDQGSGKVETKEENTEGSSSGAKASGQNNHILSFASGSKGEIAVTGELGPELRIKEDGSADLLGKKGREYAWVNPGDRIYTATQTASILGSNNIPLLDGLAKGIRNHISGYTPGQNTEGQEYHAGFDYNTKDNGFNGIKAEWSKKGEYYTNSKKKKTDPRYDPNTLKARDVIERYYTILQQIDDITKAVEHFAAVADRAWGKDRIKAINEQIKMEEKQIEAQKRYLAEIQNNLKVDKTALTTMITDFIKEYKKAGLGELPTSGIEFDENGVITNYTTVMQGFLDAYNKNPLAHAADKKYQYKFQERLKDIQMYTESLNLLEEQEEQLLNLQNQLFDTKLQKIQVELEYKTSLADDDLNLLSYQLGKVKDNAFLAAEAVDIMGQQYDTSIKKLGLQQDALRDLFALHLPDFANTSYNLTQEESELTKQLQNLEDLRAVFDNDNKEINRGKKAKIKGEDKANYTDEEKAFLESLGLYYLDENKKKHYIDDYYSSIETLYKDMYSKYSDKLPNPEDFFIYKDIKVGDKTKTYLLNYADVLQKLVDLNNQLTKNDILQEFDENGNLTNAEEVSEKVAKLYEELKERMPDVDIELKWNEENSKVLDNYREVLDAINEANSQLFDNSAIGDMFENGDWWKAFTDDGANFLDTLSSLPGYVDLTSQEVDTVRNIISTMLGELKTMWEAYENMFEMLSDTVKDHGKELNTQIGYFDHYEKIISSYKNILDLTGRNTLAISKQITSTMMNKSVDNAINKLKSSKAAYEAMANGVAIASDQLAKAEARYLNDSSDDNLTRLKKAQEAYQNVLGQYNDMEESYMQAWEDALQRAQDAFKTVLEAIAKDFEASFSPMYSSLEALSDAFNREKELEELYVKDYQRIHDLNKLARDLDQAIIDTDNIAGKEKLRDLLEEITDLQESGVELSEYDLDILQKRFDLELARQELEDAKDAKSLVRLARDNNGNWGYVYTANEDDVAEAEQKYEDAILAMEQANDEYINNLQDLLIGTAVDASDRIRNLNITDFADTDAYMAQVEKIANAANTKVEFYTSQLANAFGNNSGLAQAVINNFQTALGSLPTSLGDIFLGEAMEPNNPDALRDHFTNLISQLMDGAIEAGVDTFADNEAVFNSIDKNIGDLGSEIDDQMEKIGNSSEKNLTDTLTLVDKITTAFDALAIKLDEVIAKMTDPEVLDMMKAYENIVEQLNKVLEGTANYLPGNQESIAFEKGVEDWDTFNTILEALKKNGNISVKTMEMNENGEYGLVTRSAEQVLQMMPEWRRMLGENTIYTAEKLASMTLDDYNQLVDTYMNGNKIFKFHINNASDRKKLGAEFGLDEEGNLLVDTTTPEGKAEAQRLLEWLQVNGKKIKKGFKNQNLTDISTLHAQGGLEYNTGWSWLDGTLREPELVLNAGETKDFLKAVDILRTIDLNAKAMSNGYGSLGIGGINTIPGVLEQEVTIHAEFPNAVDHYEIEQAFDNLVNKASQYANRK